MRKNGRELLQHRVRVVFDEDENFWTPKTIRHHFGQRASRRHRIVLIKFLAPYVPQVWPTQIYTHKHTKVSLLPLLFRLTSYPLKSLNLPTAAIYTPSSLSHLLLIYRRLESDHPLFRPFVFIAPSTNAHSDVLLLLYETSHNDLKILQWKYC